ncbi:DUF484 family protein [Rheinheimera sp. WS51]|uniref:DUF484 family protein n=1 Tax=Rheinheimera sp. WS51 TaxID=3425886 RepID=UPI003D8E366D
MTEPLIQQDIIAAEVVSDYLQDHPEFFQNKPELLASLRLSHKQRGSVSLVERQLEMQREKIQALEDDITRLMSIARQNEQLFMAFNQLQAQLYQAKNLSQVQASLQQFIESMPQVHAYQLIRFNDNEIDKYQMLLSRRLDEKGVYLGRLNKDEQQVLFSSHIHSVALVLIKQDKKPLALLAFGSEHDDHFQPDMDQLFLQHLCHILTQLLPGYDAT